MSAKYTPGPWKAGTRSVRAPETEDRLGLDVRLYGGNADDNRANARLIAAAPELLAAASLLLLAAPEHMCYRNAKERRAYELLGAAIFKATGMT